MSDLSNFSYLDLLNVRYTLMPTHIRSHFAPEELVGKMELSDRSVLPKGVKC